MKKILLVEDDRLLNKTLTYNLSLDGYDIISALNVKTAVEAMKRQQFDMALLDINLPDGSGYDLCRQVNAEYPDTLLTRQVTEEEREEFIQGISAETDKLDFLFQALLKTSRLESGAICLAKTEGAIYDTLAQAVSGIVYNAEKKKIKVTVQCPEQIHVLHDRKWTAEALFNLLDNAVKYTAEGGSITVFVEQWEMYVKIDISDTGKGIAESRQASVFRRFYREEEVHDEQGVGIGLYLTREIITRQGGYVKLASEIGKGSTFSVFLPCR